MTGPSFIQTKLVNYTEALWCETEVKNNRYYYELSFDESVGWDWVERQIYKASDDFEVSVEPYKLKPPSKSGLIHIIVRDG
jgi:hypothetical protein